MFTQNNNNLICWRCSEKLIFAICFFSTKVKRGRWEKWCTKKAPPKILSHFQYIICTNDPTISNWSARLYPLSTWCYIFNSNSAFNFFNLKADHLNLPLNNLHLWVFYSPLSDQAIAKHPSHSRIQTILD